MMWDVKKVTHFFCRHMPFGCCKIGEIFVRRPLNWEDEAWNGRREEMQVMTWRAEEGDGGETICLIMMKRSTR